MFSWVSHLSEISPIHWSISLTLRPEKGRAKLSGDNADRRLGQSSKVWTFGKKWSLFLLVSWLAQKKKQFSNIVRVSAFKFFASFFCGCAGTNNALGRKKMSHKRSFVNFCSLTRRGYIFDAAWESENYSSPERHKENIPMGHYKHVKTC